MINTDHLNQIDRALLVEYTRHMRDVDTARNASRRTESNAAVTARLEPPIKKSFQTLVKLSETTDDPELLAVVQAAKARKPKAIEQLRKLARRIQQD